MQHGRQKTVRYTRHGTTSLQPRIEDANAIISECHTETAIRVRLLDIRAKATNIKGRVSADAASDYLRGFRHGLEQHGDTLATTLFD